MNQISPIVVIGTRPEATKLSPFLFTFSQRDDCNIRIFFTGQQTDLVRQVINDLGISYIFGSAMSTLPYGLPNRQWAELASAYTPKMIGNVVQ